MIIAIYIYLLKELQQLKRKQRQHQIILTKRYHLKIVHHLVNVHAEKNNTQVDDALDIDVVMSLSNLLEYKNIYSKTSNALWQHNRDDQVLTADDTIF